MGPISAFCSIQASRVYDGEELKGGNLRALRIPGKNTILHTKGRDRMAEADMQRLQQEALRRVQEMQARAQAAAQSNSSRDRTPRSNTPSGNRNPMGPGGYGNSGKSGGSRSRIVRTAVMAIQTIQAMAKALRATEPPSILPPPTLFRQEGNILTGTQREESHLRKTAPREGILPGRGKMAAAHIQTGQAKNLKSQKSGKIRKRLQNSPLTG